MDVIEKSIEKAKEFANVATQRTGEMIEAQKLKIKISSVKTKINDDMEKLGKLYYNSVKSGEDVSDALNAIVTEIDEKNKEISELRKKLVNTAGTTVCDCGYVNMADAVYCSGCGKKIK